VQDEGGDPIRIGGSEGHRDEAAVARREDDRALRRRLAKDGPEIVDEGFDRWDIPGGEPLGTAEATPIGDDQPRETG
jgi:hypothetical protein